MSTSNRAIITICALLLVVLPVSVISGTISYVDLEDGTAALDCMGRFVFGYDFGINDQSSNQKIGDIHFIQIYEKRSYPYLNILSGMFHNLPWSKSDFMPPVKPGDPLEKIFEDLIYTGPVFQLCNITPGNSYKLQILIRCSQGDRPFKVSFRDGERKEETESLNEADGKTIPGLDLPGTQWVAAIVYEWVADSKEISIEVIGDNAHIYGMTLEDISGGHVFVKNPVCRNAGLEVPTDFPEFKVPGFESEMTDLREFFWRHYITSIRGCTLWQDWMTYAALWPNISSTMRNRYNYLSFHHDFLLNARIDDYGCVATHQHFSYAHRDGWPFPSFQHSLGKGAGWVEGDLTEAAGWKCFGGNTERTNNGYCRLTLTDKDAYLLSPEVSIDSFNAPYIGIMWTRNVEGGGKPCIEWTMDEAPDFSVERRMYFPGAEDDIKYQDYNFAAIPVFRHPEWKGTIRRIRLIPAPAAASGVVNIKALMTQYDTRHTINNSNFVLGSVNYFEWTGDVEFLRNNINRMRRATKWLQEEAGGLKHKCILDPLPGHDGLPGYTGPPGKREFHPGHGIGSNYWDLLPFGHFDCYSSNYYYRSLIKLAQIEEAIQKHPEWNIPETGDEYDPGDLRKHARDVRKTIQKKFWDKEDGRFVGWIDANGDSWDYGFTFLNLELIAGGVASRNQAKDILDWINGERIIEGDTSTGKDIYEFRIAPRATTLRNIDTYQWVWSMPESIAFGGQVQDGGAVLGFSHYDLMSRLDILGPDSAWQRLKEIIEWYHEVQDFGGYRNYYADGSKGTTLQGAGTAGGLGIDAEFIETMLVPQIMLYGFLGFDPNPDYAGINPQLPTDWPSLCISNINYQGINLEISAGRDSLEIVGESDTQKELRISLPGEKWRVTEGKDRVTVVDKRRNSYTLDIDGKSLFKFEKN